MTSLDSWIRVCNMGKQKMRSSDKDTMLFRLLRERRDAEVYMRSIGYRVIYTENSIQKETIFTKDGEYLSGDKPNLSVPSHNVNPNTLQGLYEQIQKDPTNILLNKEQIAAIQKKYSNKPLGKFLDGRHAPRVWLQIGGGAPTYRIVVNSYHRDTTHPLAYDFTFSFNGDVIKGNDERFISVNDKSAKFTSASKKLFVGGKKQLIKTNKER